MSTMRRSKHVKISALNHFSRRILALQCLLKLIAQVYGARTHLTGAKQVFLTCDAP